MSALDDFIAKGTPTPATPKTGAVSAPVALPSTGGSALDAFIRSTGKDVVTPISAPVAPKVTAGSLAKSFGNWYMGVSDKLGNYGANLDLGLVKSVGGIVGGVEDTGQAVGSIGIAINHALGGNAVQEDSDVGDTIKNFADSVRKKANVTDNTYLDKVFEGLGGAIPYIAGGAAAKAFQIPALLSSLGIGAIQALDTAKTDYHEMVASGQPHSGAKAAAVFGVDLALNTVSHYLGPLAEGGGPGLLSSVGRILKSTALETANQGFGQAVVSNVAKGKPPMEGVWNNVLVMLPISAGFGLAGEAATPHEKQVASVFNGVADEGGQPQDAVAIVKELSGVDADVVQNTFDRYVADNPEVGEKYEKNTEDNLEKISQKTQEQVPLAVAEEEYSQTKPAKARLFSENVEEPKPVTEPEKSPGDISNEYTESIAPDENTPSTDIEEAKPVIEGDTVDVKSADGTVMKEGAKVEKIAEFDGKQYAKIEGSETYTPVEHLEQKTEGKTKKSLFGKRVEAEAIERGLTDGLKGTAMYEPKVVKDQSEKISELMNNDFEKAERILTGDEPVPVGMSGSMFLIAMEDYAGHTNDVELTEKIANSPIASETSIHASEMRLLRERNSDSPASQMTDIKQKRTKNADKKLGSILRGSKRTTVAKEKVKIVDDIKSSIEKEKVTTDDWSSFIDSIEC